MTVPTSNDEETAVEDRKIQLDPPVSEDVAVTEEGETESQTMSDGEDYEEEEGSSSEEEEEKEDEFVVKSRTLKRLQAQDRSTALQETSLNINSNSNGESSSDSDDDDDDDDKPASFYSKPTLKATGHGSLLQTGADPHSQSSKKSSSKPIYATQQLKATGFGDVVKKGSDVPREFVAHDPNANLGQVYQSASGKFKATGFADKLKQGQDVPREYVANDPNANLGDVYASVPLKKSGIDPEQQQNKAKVVPSSLPPVQLQKTQLPTHKTASKNKSYELPEEFSIAKQNLKRRTERPWYSKGVPHAAQAPKQKWFFQRGEWMPKRHGDNDTTTATASSNQTSWFGFGTSRNETKTTTSTTSTTTTTYYRGSNTTLHHLPKKAQQSNHNLLQTNATKTTKKKLKPGSKEYYQEIQFRRGLTPKSHTTKNFTFWKILLLWLPLLVCVYVGIVSHYPELAVSVPPSLQPKVDVFLAEVQPHWETLHSTIQPHVQWARSMAQKHVHPPTVKLVDNLCSRVETYELPTTQYQTWLEPIHSQLKSICYVSRARLGMTTQQGEPGVQEEESLEDPSQDTASTSTSVEGGESNTKCHCQENQQHHQIIKSNKLKKAFSKLFPKRNNNNNNNNNKLVEDSPHCDCSQQKDTTALKETSKEL